jgi:endonuclease/exonuclease/phosphatase family metal-dependent hydrolase
VSCALAKNLRPVRSLSLLTINIHKGFSFFNKRFILPELREAVRTAGADIVFLQEVHGSHDLHAARYADWPDTSHYEFLADSIWNDFAYGRNAVYPEGDHGNALLSKYPISSYQNLDVSISGPERRGLLHCQLAVPGQAQVHAICVHLGLREKHRALQLGLLCDLLDTLPATAPVLIAGDFNDWRLRAPQILGRCERLHEAFEREYGIAARSFPARWPLLRLDRIYVRNASTHCPRILSMRPWSHLSDHAPLAVEVRL